MPLWGALKPLESLKSPFAKPTPVELTVEPLNGNPIERPQQPRNSGPAMPSWHLLKELLLNSLIETFSPFTAPLGGEKVNHPKP